MTFECRQLDDVLREAEPTAMAGARDHANGCAACREQLLAWDAVSEGAPLLRSAWESPTLWPRIEQALDRETARRRTRGGAARWLATAAIAAAVVAVVASRVALRGPSLPGAREPEQSLLTERALEDVERSETRYAASIDRLAKVAEPLIAKPDTPLLASYREKLQVLDAAIADCRDEIGRNRFNARLRLELLSIYREKQHTLEQIMGERT
jgi:hypothetical protein